MEHKFVLTLIDGMRPDGATAIDHPFVKKMMAEGTSTLTARTVMPSVTLPCHMSLFHSVDPDRHGILTNTFVPQVRPVDGLFDVLFQNGKKSASFITWEMLRNLGVADHIHYMAMVNQHQDPDSTQKITDAAIAYIQKETPDFTFFYLGETDERGHAYGWMGPEYLAMLKESFDCTERLWNHLPEGYSMLVIADHGGHGRHHGTDLPEDMTIPMFGIGPLFEAGKQFKDACIKDVAPTVAKIFGMETPKEWEGKSLL